MANTKTIFDTLPTDVREAHVSAYDAGKREAARAWTVEDSAKKGRAEARRAIGKGLVAFSTVDIAAEFAGE